jgi:Lipid A 3-O-deacylase (PagL)
MSLGRVCLGMAGSAMLALASGVQAQANDRIATQGEWPLARGSLLPISLGFQPDATDGPQREPQDDDQLPRVRPQGPFGTVGTQWITAGALFADDFDTSTDVNVHIAWSQFVSRDVEFALELAAWRMVQDGDDATAINPSAIFRWHFYNRERWSLFGDIGIGLLVSTDDVPSGGTSFNFTPKVGGGLTYKLWEEHETRLVVGVRWHHISNARIAGDEANPARDAVALYAGLRWGW